MYKPDHRQSHGEQVMQHTLVLAPGMRNEGGVYCLFSLRIGKGIGYSGFPGLGRGKENKKACQKSSRINTEFIWCFPFCCSSPIQILHFACILNQKYLFVEFALSG